MAEMSDFCCEDFVFIWALQVIRVCGAALAVEDFIEVFLLHVCSKLF